MDFINVPHMKRIFLSLAAIAGLSITACEQHDAADLPPHYTHTNEGHVSTPANEHDSKIQHEAAPHAAPQAASKEAHAASH
jgi:hypothetical protein